MGRISLNSVVLIISLLGTLAMVQPVNAEYCYQETANESHVSDGTCDLLYNGSYLFSPLTVPFPLVNSLNEVEDFLFSNLAF